MPDYDSPYSSILTDKPIYTWTDKILMKIIAPSWNTDRHLIDSIGGDDEHPIKIATREHSVEPYRFVETDANSGVFAAEIILTGFLHDANGDGDFDTVPRTSGHGPTNGFLEVDRDSAVTITFEFADGVIVSESVPVSWNMGVIAFSHDLYLPGDFVQIRVVDPDLNLNPDALDQIQVKVSSDSDVAGVRIVATETGQSTGMFIGNLSFTQNQSTSGTRLYAIPGDTISAQYDDHTLPKPHSTSDMLVVEATARLDSAISGTDRITNSGVVFADGTGNRLTSFSAGSQIQIMEMLSNEQEFQQQLVYLVQVKDETGTVVSLSWLHVDLVAHQNLTISQSWTPTNSGTYQVDTFVWNSLSEMFPLTHSVSISLLVR